ncbi:MAG TPA: amidohydrolase family protein [Bacillota bacterium]
MEPASIPVEPESYDLVVRNARLRGRGEGLFDLGLRAGGIAAIGPAPLAARPGSEIDAAGNLVTEPFVNAHLHLCKAYTRSLAGDEALRRYTGDGMGRAMNAIELAAAVKERYAAAWIEDNARRALLEGVRHGVLHVLAFADTDTRARLEGVKGVLAARDSLAGVMDVRVVAFPQDGLLRDPGAEDLMRKALDLGADVVGGIPWIEFTDAAAREHVRRLVDLAAGTGRAVAMLVDDAGDPALRTTEMLAEAAIAAGLEGRVVACHARALATYPEPSFRRLLGLARQAGMGFVTDPHTGPLHLRAFDMLEAGLPVALGQDDIADAYYPFGRHNLLEVAFLAAHILNRSTGEDLERLYDMITVEAARVLGIKDYGLRPGGPADLVVLDGCSIHEALTRHAPPRYVVAGGRVVCENVRETRWNL